ncbi:MAG: HlyD family efflux transporter periplasmic adaptor subunit [Candidatus Electrothrix sp. GW3-4]|uniref:efflux RND transporter periplasmic adaptor subunit n=1 Tax=Candidatus Electrothrix sp. GW3-4 TaxID=3126740 RepID=UPI0030CAFB55
MKVILKALLSLLILAVAAGVAWHFYTHKPRPKKARPQRAIPLVQAITVQPGTEPVAFEASGTVMPARRLVVSSEVEGRILQQNTNLVPGGIIRKDDLLIRLDDRDYRFQVRERQAELATAEYELAVEQGKQVIARQEWQILAKEMNKAQANRDLALRKPHLRHVQAQIAAAKARLEAAQLAEARTSIRAPFTAIVLEEEVEKGQFIGRQVDIATLAATETFWVQVAVPLFLLERIRFPDQAGQQGSKVEIILDRGQGSRPLLREGRVYSLLADLAPKGRMARLLVNLPDPLCLGTEEMAEEVKASCAPEEKILLDSFVRVRIDAGQLEQVLVLPAKALREGNRLWVVNAEGLLSFREAQVRWRRVDEVLVEAKIGPDERVITSRLQAPIPGMKVREESEENPLLHRGKILPER